MTGSPARFRIASPDPRSHIAHLWLLAGLLLAVCPLDRLSAAEPPPSQPAGRNRLTYLDDFLDPYYVGRDFPKLTTPQWVGEPDVKAVVTLAIDDMRDIPRYETYLRPILERLKQIDGRAPVSIMTNRVDPQDPHLQRWLKEGLSLEVHTYDHPCPCLQGGDFGAALGTYEKCVDLLSEIPNSSPVAFRMPCCDSQNTPSPRFWSEIFNRRTDAGNFLSIDSSVFQVFTPDDPELPREWTVNEAGDSRFRRYIPFPSFVNTIENYPYPYVIGKLCWEMPCMVPSDWEAQHVQQPNNPQTVRDMQIALDAVVAKQGVFNLVFHPHGWIRNDQVNELIDHARQKHGDAVKFLTFQEVQQRLTKHLGAGQPLRGPRGEDNGVRLLDLNADGYLDVVIGNPDLQRTRIWNPEAQAWNDLASPLLLVREQEGRRVPTGLRFGQLSDGSVFALVADGPTRGAWVFDQGKWTANESLAQLPEVDGLAIQTGVDGVDRGVRLRDVTGDVESELIVANPDQQTILRWNPEEGTDGKWERLDWRMPRQIAIVDGDGRDAGLRFRDLDGDGLEDLVFSDEARYSIHLADVSAEQPGWSVEVTAAERSEAGLVPMIVRQGTNNGAWFADEHLWVQNEDTTRLPDKVDRRSYVQLLEPLEAKKAAAEDLRNAPWFQVGAATVEITPQTPVRLAGYGSRKHESEGVEQPIYAKALLIQAPDDQTPPAILISVENCSAPAEIVEQVAAELEQKLKLPRPRLVVVATHTHTGPHLSTSLPFIFGEPLSDEHRKHIDEYSQFLQEKLVEVAVKAHANRQEARLFVGRGTVGFAANRRVLKEGVWTGFGVQPEGPVDHEVSVLAAKDRSGQIVALLTNYACHCTTLGGDFNQVCGDWAGYASEYLESRLAESQTAGPVAMISIGCGADANPEPRGKLEMAQQHGRSLADAVERILQQELKPLDSPLSCRLARIDLPLDTPPTLDEWRQRAEQPGAFGLHARHFLDWMAQGGQLPTTVNYPVATWTFGDDLAMVFLGGEVVVDYAIRMKEEFRADRLWITAYANDVPCYIPSRRILREGGYEADRSMVYYGQPTRFAPEVEDLVVDTVQKLLPPWFYSEAKQQDFPPPRNPEESRKTMHVPSGLRVELVAAEPLIQDPVAFDWGPDGSLWVVEMRDYPNGMDGQGTAGGRVKVLRDSDGDGRYDQSRVFLDNLPFPSGVTVWRGGVLVTAAPDVLFAEDTDGDDRADRTQVVYRGFREGNQQHRVNGFRWGLDNWLYAANGDSGGTIESTATKQLVGIGGRDLRIRPDSGDVDAVSGQTQFGRNRNDWGDWFGGNNSNPMWHYVLDDFYLRRNPHFAAREIRRQVAEVPGAAPIFPASRTLARFNDFNRADRFTSACSPIVYRDERLGSEYLQNAFICEPVHNLVHREVMRREGASYASRRAENEQQSEFLASEDNWFRPVMVRTGPDGALWVADMYRFVIEHPEWIPQEWQRKLDLRAGSRLGRIYRITREDAAPFTPPAFKNASTAELVDLLSSPNGWQRDMAHQMLLWRADKSAIVELTRLLQTSGRAATRLQALCVLDGMSAVTDEHLARALNDSKWAVRRHAVRLAASHAALDTALFETLLGLVEDPDPAVRLQLAYTLGESKRPEAAEALARLMQQDGQDVHIRSAIFSSLRPSNIGRLLADAFPRDGKPLEGWQADVQAALLSQAVAMGDSVELDPVLARIARPHSAAGNDEVPFAAWQFAAMRAMLDALPASKTMRLLPDDEANAERLRGLFEAARKLAASESSDPRLRVAAIGIVGRGPYQRDGDLALLADQLDPRTPPNVQQAIVAALGSTNSKSVPPLLLAGWSSHSPTLRVAILDTLLQRSAWTLALLEALENGTVPEQQIAARYRQLFHDHKESDIRERAGRLWKPAAARAEVLAKFEPVLQIAGDSQRGAAVFEKRCAVCHRIGDVGHAVGPDLTSLTDRSPRTLLTAVFDPNRAVEDKYREYQAVTLDGRQHAGILAEETSASITLLAAEGKQVTLLRSELEALQSKGKSLMPEGMEKDLSSQDIADVIAYLNDFRPAHKQFEGNEPQVAPVRDDGSIRLLATNCRIYGSTLVFEPKYRNLGFWGNADDMAMWSIEAPRAGRYRVQLDYACADSTAGNRFLLRVAGQTLNGEVPGTGSWDNYRGMVVGTVRLPEGRSELVFQSDGKPNGFLMDLRAIILSPLD